MVFIFFFFCQFMVFVCLLLMLMMFDDWVFVIIIGVDSEKYMQGQVIVDVSQMVEDQYLFVVYCDVKGKMWSNLCLFCDGDGFVWIEWCSVCELQLIELKKYVVFFKVIIVLDDECVLFGVVGFQVCVVLVNFFSELFLKEKQVVKEGVIILLWFEYLVECFLIVIDEVIVNMLIDKLCGEVELNNS